MTHTSVHHVTGPDGLTNTQRAYKRLFCLTVTALMVVVAVWSGLWLLSGLTHGIVSGLHLALLLASLLLAVIFDDLDTGERR